MRDRRRSRFGPKSVRTARERQLMSATTLVERAKNLYERAEYRAALHNFEIVARQPVPVGRDVWLDAVFGMAECRRLSNDFRGAADGYRVLLGAGLRSLPRSGPHALIMPVYVVQSFAMLTRIGRLSIRVPTPLLLKFLELGHQWAREHIDPRAADTTFRFEYALLMRHTRGPKSGAEELDALARELEESPVEGAVDHHIVLTWAAESWLDTGVYAPLQQPPAPDHYAYHWTRYRGVLQKTRWHLMSGDKKRARRLVADEVLESELDARHPGLVLELERLRATVGDESNLLGYRELILREQPRSPLHNRTAYLWHTIQLAMLQLARPQLDRPQLDRPQLNRHRNGAKPNAVTPLDGPFHDDLRRLHDAVAEPAVATTLQSRGFERDQHEQLLAWCRGHNGAGWQTDGMRLLEKLAPLVRP